jgi:hypothetical protein
MDESQQVLAEIPGISTHFSKLLTAAWIPTNEKFALT